MKSGFPKVLKTGEKYCFKTIDNYVFNEEGYPLSDRIIEHDFHKMTLGIIGDGISANKTDTDGNLIGYINLLSNKFESVINYSKSGMCIAKSKNINTGIDINVPSMVTEYTNIDQSIDIILVACSSNDWNNSVPIDTDTDNDLYAYRDALEIIINGLLTTHVGKEIIFITPIHRHDTTHTTNQYESSIIKNAYDHTLSDYADVIKEVCKKHSIPVIDLLNTCGIDFENEAHREIFTENGVHPNKNGHYRLYRRIYSALASLI